MYREIMGRGGVIDPFFILRINDNAQIPRDEGNRDYQEFLAWEAAGGTITPYVPDAPTADDVARQALLAKVADTNLSLTQRFTALATLLGYVHP